MDFQTVFLPCLAVLGSLCLVQASKTNDITINDILVWTEDHSTRHELSRKGKPLTIEELKQTVKREKSDHAYTSMTCTERALHRCDVSAMAKLLHPDESPCSLLKEYQFCLYQESKHCTGSAKMLTASLDNVLVGLQSNGHCMELDIQSNTLEIQRRSRPSKPCGRRGVWMCTQELLEDLRSSTNACSSMTRYRHCVYEGTQPCARHASDDLIRGTRGLARLYRRLTKQC